MKVLGNSGADRYWAKIDYNFFGNRRFQKKKRSRVVRGIAPSGGGTANNIGRTGSEGGIIEVERDVSGQTRFDVEEKRQRKRENFAPIPRESA